MREKLILFGYEFKNAVKGMIRHWALCLSAITTVFLTLTLIAVLVVAGVHVDVFSRSIADDLTIHAILDEGIDSPEQISVVEEQINRTVNVDHSEFSDRDAELEIMIAQKGEAFEQYRGEENPLSNAFFVYVTDETKMEETKQALEQIDGVSTAYYGGKSVNQLADLLVLIRNVSGILVGLLMLLSLYLIYNAIRASIASRQEEISVMRTVGATSAFIKVPFEIEGILIGMLGALIPWLLIYFGYPALYEQLHGRLFMNLLSLVKPDQMIALCTVVLFGIGIVCGFLASLMAVNRYLRKVR